MKQKLKPLILIFTLAIPVAIFLFLKAFGTNSFDIPVFYKQGVPFSFNECEFSNEPFLVGGDWRPSDKPEIVSFYKPEAKLDQELSNITQRLKATFDEKLNVKLLKIDSTGGRNVMHCQYATDTLSQFVLVDTKGQIRGYYNKDLDEIDRLIVEVKILLENNQ